MLVLSRHRDESIIITIGEGVPIGTRIKLTVADIRGDKIRLGIDAPKEVEVHREEIQVLVDRDRERDREHEESRIQGQA